MPEKPLDVLDASLEEPIAVSLKDGSVIEGSLLGYDQHLNLVVAGDGPDGEGTTVIRGDNVVTIDT